jgi:hypothetical protein
MERNLSGSRILPAARHPNTREITTRERGAADSQINEMVYNPDIIPYRFGPGWKMTIRSEKNEPENDSCRRRWLRLFAVNEYGKRT